MYDAAFYVFKSAIINPNDFARFPCIGTRLPAPFAEKVEVGPGRRTGPFFCGNARVPSGSRDLRSNSAKTMQIKLAGSLAGIDAVNKVRIVMSGVL